jgi:hypothetical protein
MREAIMLGVLLVGCGGPAHRGAEEPGPAAAPTPPDCAALRAETLAARQLLEACRSASPAAEWAHREHFEWLEQQVGSRLMAIRQGEEVAITQLEAQEVAEHVWTLLDAVAEECGDRALLDRAETAAEALLREQAPDARLRVLASLAGALGAIRAALESARAEGRGCEREERAAAEAWLRAQAACGSLDRPFER